MPVSYHGGVSRPFVQPDVFKGATEPQTPNLGDLWVDLSGVTPDLKQCFALSPLTWTSITPYNLTSLVINSGTITASEPVLDLSQTWNNAAVTFTGINFAFTATAAAGGSKAFVISETSTYGTIFSIDRYGGFYNYGSLYSSNRFSVGYAAEIIHIKSSIPLGWGTGDPNTGTLDTALFRDAAAILALRNGTNAQTYRVYGTYTDSSNYVRASLSSSSTAVTLAAETAGTGADNVPVNITPTGTEGVQIGNFAQLTEMTAPAAGAANTARIFAEDNGAGKTRIMAQFASGAAVQIAIEP